MKKFLFIICCLVSINCFAQKGTWNGGFRGIQADSNITTDGAGNVTVKSLNLFDINNTGLTSGLTNITGNLTWNGGFTATSLVGDGNSITNIPATALTGTLTMPATIPVGYSVITKTTNYTLNLAADCVVFVNGTTLTMTLPTTSGKSGRFVTLKLVASSTATIATTSSQTIDGASTYSLSALNKYVTVISDGTNWKIIANN